MARVLQRGAQFGPPVRTLPSLDRLLDTQTSAATETPMTRAARTTEALERLRSRVTADVQTRDLH